MILHCYKIKENTLYTLCLSDDNRKSVVENGLWIIDEILDEEQRTENDKGEFFYLSYTDIEKKDFQKMYRLKSDLPTVKKGGWANEKSIPFTFQKLF